MEGSCIDVLICTALAVLSYADYYPFGWQMRGRNQQGDYRYAYQGQEKDPETGWEAFELRMYDGRVGRWMTTDPYSQYHSPYLAMGNNPVNGTDPDGGFWQELKNWTLGRGWVVDDAYKFMQSMEANGHQMESKAQANNLTVVYDTETYEEIAFDAKGREVMNFEGAYVVAGLKEKGGGVTYFRNKIVVPENYIKNGELVMIKHPIKDSNGRTLFSFTSMDVIKHEYGHYLQAQKMSFIQYYGIVGISSLLSAITRKGWGKGDGIFLQYYPKHMLSPMEVDANRRAGEYFETPPNPNYFISPIPAKRQKAWTNRKQRRLDRLRRF